MRDGAENRKYRVQGLVWKQQRLAGSVKLPGERAGSGGGVGGQRGGRGGRGHSSWVLEGWAEHSGLSLSSPE